MNDNLDLTQILKDCPKGTVFYSTNYGDVKLENINESRYYSITFKDKQNIKHTITKNGYHFDESMGECTFFPSKDQRDWSKWHRPFVDGDVLYARTVNSKYEYIFIKKDGYYQTSRYVSTTNNLNNLYFCTGPCMLDDEIKELRFATEEEKQKLFDAIKAKGYEWNSEQKELIKLKFNVGDTIKIKKICHRPVLIVKIENGKYLFQNYGSININEQDNWEIVSDKFDISILQSFNKILVRRNDYGKWNIDFFGFYNKGDFHTTGSSIYEQCVPYNDETKHLVGTTEKAPEKYINW